MKVVIGIGTSPIMLRLTRYNKAHHHIGFYDDALPMLLDITVFVFPTYSSIISHQDVPVGICMALRSGVELTERSRCNIAPAANTIRS